MSCQPIYVWTQDRASSKQRSGPDRRIGPRWKRTPRPSTKRICRSRTGKNMAPQGHPGGLRPGRRLGDRHRDADGTRTDRIHAPGTRRRSGLLFRNVSQPSVESSPWPCSPYAPWCSWAGLFRGEPPLLMLLTAISLGRGPPFRKHFPPSSPSPWPWEPGSLVGPAGADSKASRSGNPGIGHLHLLRQDRNTYLEPHDCGKGPRWRTTSAIPRIEKLGRKGGLGRFAGSESPFRPAHERPGSLQQLPAWKPPAMRSENRPKPRCSTSPGKTAIYERKLKISTRGSRENPLRFQAKAHDYLPSMGRRPRRFLLQGGGRGNSGRAPKSWSPVEALEENGTGRKSFKTTEAIAGEGLRTLGVAMRVWDELPDSPSPEQAGDGDGP